MRKANPKPERPVVTRYRTADGRRCKAGTPGATRETVQSESYFVRLKNPHTGKREWVPLGTTEEQAAWKRLAEVLDERAREAAGVPARLLAHAVKPLAEHLDDWVEQLRASGNTGGEQLALLRGRMAILSGLADWTRLGQIDRDSTVKALSRLQRDGRGAQTRNHYLRHIKQFCVWCVEEQRLERNPVAGVDPVNVEVDKRHPRRCPSETEVALLMAYLEGPDAPARCGMSGPSRGLAYRLCMATGYRAGELRSLTRSSFDLGDLEAGTVKARPAHTKNRKAATTPIPAWLVSELRAHFDAGGDCWGDWPENWPGRLLVADQQAAGVEHQTEDGFFDFHALRHWFLTWAANQPDISPKTLQSIARHSDPRLTLKIYARAQAEEVRKVIDELPRPGRAS